MVNSAWPSGYSKVGYLKVRESKTLSIDAIDLFIQYLKVLVMLPCSAVTWQLSELQNKDRLTASHPHLKHGSIFVGALTLACSVDQLLELISYHLLSAQPADPGSLPYPCPGRNMPKMKGRPRLQGFEESKGC